MLRYTKRTMKRHILQVHDDQRPRHQHVSKASVIGLGFSEGSGLLDQRLGRLSPEERALASRAHDELRADDLLVASYENPHDPEGWCYITERGRVMLERSLLDELDAALFEIDRSLIDRRDGAHDRMRSSGPDAARQAAHSAQELMNRLLRHLAPDDEVRQQPWWEQASGERGVSRSQRLRLALRKRGREDEWEEVRELWNVAVRRAQRLRHYPDSTAALSAKDVVHLAETALKELLLGTAGGGDE